MIVEILKKFQITTLVMPNCSVSYTRVCIRFLHVIIVLGFAILTKPVFALTPEDILVVYNQSMIESRAVAEHYIKKRKVPPENIIGVSVSFKESISRTEFDSNLVSQLRKSLTHLKRVGKKYSILLVYGIPIRIKEDKPTPHNDKRERLIQGKIDEFGKIVADLTKQLEKLLATFEQSPENHSEAKNYDLSNTSGILEKAKDMLMKASNLQAKEAEGKIPPEIVLEMGSILFRLAGMSPIAFGLQKQIVNEQESSLRHKNNEFLKLTTILNRQLAKIPFRGVIDDNIQDVASIVRASQCLIGELIYWYGLKESDPSSMTSASVDSELSLMLAEPYLKSRWLPNPFLDQFKNIPGIEEVRNNTIMVARLDGPTPEIAKRLVDDAVWAENNGLDGIFYIDARGLEVKDKGGAYSQYDEHLRNLNTILKEKSSMRVVFDDSSELFPENSCPEAALYCGWYSLKKYVDSFEWQRGAVGFHIASAEASTLKKKGSQVWCKRMLEEGVSATLGPVNEPYLQSFPRPDVFFPLLMTGQTPLLEVYYKSIPFLSWRQILIGDPLYTPFMKRPALAINETDNQT